MEVFINIESGKIINRKVIRNAFNNLSDGRYKVAITKSNKRSLQQNAYYFGVCVPIVLEGLRDAGYNEVKTIDDAHEIIKYRFLKKSIGSVDGGEVVELIGSTTELTTVKFMELIAEVQQWASEFLGVVIPDPGQQVEIFN